MMALLDAPTVSPDDLPVTGLGTRGLPDHFSKGGVLAGSSASDEHEESRADSGDGTAWRGTASETPPVAGPACRPELAFLPRTSERMPRCGGTDLTSLAVVGLTVERGA